MGATRPEANLKRDRVYVRNVNRIIQRRIKFRMKYSRLKSWMLPQLYKYSTSWLTQALHAACTGTCHQTTGAANGSTCLHCWWGLEKGIWHLVAGINVLAKFPWEVLSERTEQWRVWCCDKGYVLSTSNIPRRFALLSFISAERRSAECPSLRICRRCAFIGGGWSSSEGFLASGACSASAGCCYLACCGRSTGAFLDLRFVASLCFSFQVSWK